MAGDPLIRNGHALNLSTVVSSLVGLLFWVFAARRYPAAVIGRNSVALSAMMFFGGVAQLNLASALVRFLPTSGRHGRRLILGVYGLSAAVAVGLSTVFLALVPVLVPSLHFIDDSWAMACWFVASTACWAIFVLEDGALTGLRRTGWVPVENGFFAALKAAVVIPLARVLPGVGVFVAWSASTLATVVPTNKLLFGRVVDERRIAGLAGRRLTGRELWRFGAYDFVGSVFWLGATSLLPLLVIARVGAGESATFQLTWVLAYALYLVSINLGSSLVVETASDQSALWSEVRRVRRHLLLLLFPVVLVLVIGAPVVLTLFGSHYAAQGVTTLRLLATSALPFIVSATAVSACRSLKRTRAGCVLNAALFSVVTALSWALLPVLGIEGVAIGWCAAQGSVALIVLATERRWLFADTGPADDRRSTVMELARLAHSIGMPRRLGSLRAWLGERRARGAVHEVLLEAEALLGGAPADLDVAIRRGGSDRMVALVAGRDRPARVVKLARSEEAEAEFYEEQAILEQLRKDRRLASLRPLLPQARLEKLPGGAPVVLERPMAGTDAGTLLRHCSSGAPRISELAMEVIGRLHEATASVRRVTPELFELWLAEPLRLLSVVHPTGRPPSFQREAVRRIDEHLRHTLVDAVLPLSWIHGDFTPGNLIVADDLGAVTGIIDWSQASPKSVAALDRVLWSCAVEATVSGRDMGAVVGERLTELWTQGVEAAPRDRHGRGAVADLPHDTVLLWCWLQHVAGNIAKASGYARNPFWWVANVEPVLKLVLA